MPFKVTYSCHFFQGLTTKGAGNSFERSALLFHWKLNSKLHYCQTEINIIRLCLLERISSQKYKSSPNYNGGVDVKWSGAYCLGILLISKCSAKMSLSEKSIAASHGFNEFGQIF